MELHGESRSANKSSTFSGSTNQAEPFSLKPLLQFLQCGAMSDDDSLGQEDKQRSDELDKYLQIEGEKTKRDLKMIVFGLTVHIQPFWKRMRLVETPFSDKDMPEGLVIEMRKNLVDLLVGEIDYQLKQSIKSQENKDIAADVEASQLLQKWDKLPIDTDSDYADSARGVVALLEDVQFKKILQELDIDISKLPEKNLQRAYPSFLSCPCGFDSTLLSLVKRVSSPGYKPDEHDWVHFGRNRFGSFVREVQIQRADCLIRLLDLKMHGERRKWIHLFEDTTATIFVADLNGYDISLFEENEAYELTESLMLYDSIVNSRWFQKSSCLLLLANTEAFKRKLKERPLSSTFPEYKGLDDDSALEFVAEKFRKTIREESCAEKAHVFYLDSLGSFDQFQLVEFMEEVVLKDYISSLRGDPFQG